MYRKRILLTVLALGTAVWTLGQVHSNAPTDKDYRLSISSPKDGAALTGTDLTIVLRMPSIPSGQSVSEKERTDVMTPTFQVWVDGKDYGNLPTGQNVFTAHDVSYGPHKITVAAKNTAGELVDRKEISVTTSAAGSMQMSQTDQVPPAAAAAAPVSAPAPAPAAAAPEQAPAPMARHKSAPTPSLPKTATSYPAAAVAGIGLLIAGLVLSRPRSS